PSGRLVATPVSCSAASSPGQAASSTTSPLDSGAAWTAHASSTSGPAALAPAHNSQAPAISNQRRNRSTRRRQRTYTADQIPAFAPQFQVVEDCKQDTG